MTTQRHIHRQDPYERQTIRGCCYSDTPLKIYGPYFHVGLGQYQQTVFFLGCTEVISSTAPVWYLADANPATHCNFGFKNECVFHSPQSTCS